MLASSFIQQSLSTNVVGLLGVLVLISSLVHQRIRPDLIASGARKRAYMTRVLMRSIEVDLLALKNNQPNALLITAIRKKAADALAEIARDELSESKRENTDPVSNG